VQPDDFVLILLVGRLIESWSHANVDMSFGRLGERLLVGPRFHRLHHALAGPRNATSTTTISRLFSRSGTFCSAPAIYDGRHRPTGRRRSRHRCRQRPRLGRPAD
jgi:sterol desaturase/sphingolipid hydroxylase (fatty acid hydroxylase superfamily)